jgi:outer membrane receptor protein involved in Fe transport
MAKTSYAAISIFLVLCHTLLAQTEKDSLQYGIEDLFQYSLDELLSMRVSSATKFEESVNEIPHAVFIITKEDIEIYGYRTLAEALQHVPGFYVHDDHNMYKENFGVRGVFRDEWNQNIIFLVNGARQRSGYDFNNKLVYINVPIKSVERIEVIKGPASVSYGSGAFYGVINIITTSDQAQKNNVYLSAGTQNTFEGGINISNHADDLKLFLNAGFLTTNGIDQNYRDMGLDTDHTSGDYMHEKSGYMSVHMKTKGFYASLSIDRHFNTRPIYSIPYENQTYEKENDFMAMRFLIGSEHTFSKKLQVNTNLQYQFQEEEFILDFSDNDHEQATQNATVDQVEFDVNTKYLIKDYFNVSMGGNVFFVPRSKDQLDIPVANLTNTYRELMSPLVMWGAYLRMNWKPTETLQIRAGVRADKIEVFDLRVTQNRSHSFFDPDALILDPLTLSNYSYPKVNVAILPEVSAIYNLTGGQQLKLIYGEAINRPPIYRLNNTAQYGIKPEYIKNLELIYNHHSLDKLKWGSSFIYSMLKDIIINDFIVGEDGTITNLLRNGGDYTVFGIEGLLDYMPLQNLTLSVSGNYYLARDNHHPDIYPGFSPRFLGHFNASYLFHRFTFAITNHYVSSMHAKYDFNPADPEDSQSLPVGRAGEASPGYLNTGLNISYSPGFLEGIRANVRISNLLNQKMYYPVNDFNSWASKGTLGIGRTSMVSINYKF